MSDSTLAFFAAQQQFSVASISTLLTHGILQTKIHKNKHVFSDLHER
jgi:hypothetical protein